MSRTTLISSLLLSLASGLVVAGCGSTGPATASPVTAGVVSSGAEDTTADVIVIDVRTPAEYDMGHLSGALNLDLEGGALEAALADLDPSASYIVYCRSGNRSATATALMRARGITRIQDLGPLENAAATTGLDVITGPEPG